MMGRHHIQGIRKCAVCGRLFSYAHPQKRYCSRQCAERERLVRVQTPATRPRSEAGWVSYYHQHEYRPAHWWADELARLCVPITAEYLYEHVPSALYCKLRDAGIIEPHPCDLDC